MQHLTRNTVYPSQADYLLRIYSCLIHPKFHRLWWPLILSILIPPTTAELQYLSFDKLIPFKFNFYIWLLWRTSWWRDSFWIFNPKVSCFALTMMSLNAMEISKVDSIARWRLLCHKCKITHVEGNPSLRSNTNYISVLINRLLGIISDEIPLKSSKSQ